MKLKINYDYNAKYSTKDLKGGYSSSSNSALDTYLNEKGPSTKI